MAGAACVIPMASRLGRPSPGGPSSPSSPEQRRSGGGRRPTLAVAVARVGGRPGGGRRGLAVLAAATRRRGRPLPVGGRIRSLGRTVGGDLVGATGGVGQRLERRRVRPPAVVVALAGRPGLAQPVPGGSGRVRSGRVV